MAAQSSPVPPRISPIDRHGKDINPAVIAAAEEVYARALEHGLKLLGDPAVVVDALEQVAAAVSRLVRTEAPSGAPAIKNLPGAMSSALSSGTLTGSSEGSLRWRAQMEMPARHARQIHCTNSK